MLRGEEPTAPEDSENAVNDMPKQFNDWIEEHREQIELSRLRGNEPYFLRDNTGRVNTALGISQSQPVYIQPTLFDTAKPEAPKVTPAEARAKVIDELRKRGSLPKEAIDKLEQITDPEEFNRRADSLRSVAERHEKRTERQIAEIQQEATMRAKTIRSANALLKDFEGIDAVDTSALQDAVKHGRWADARAEALVLAQRKRSILKLLKEEHALVSLEQFKSNRSPKQVNGIITELETKQKAYEFLHKIDNSVQKSDITITNGAVALTIEQHRLLAQSQKVRYTEHHAIYDDYIGTPNSFKINGALRDVKHKGQYAIHGKVRGNPNVPFAADMKGAKLKPDDIDTIEALDAVVARHTTPFPIRVVRHVNFDAVESLFSLSNMPENSDATNYKTVIDHLSKKDIRQDEGFASVSTVPDANLFKDRDCQLEIIIPEGAPMFISTNQKESEGILGRETKLYYENHFCYNGKLIIQCRVEK